ncbi:DUF3153 domain-containing protein [Hazenella sp. IB182353]|uniref:DUF3153 domain-containing protein n=1 Tax=Polycladospora coralii TaxID=2771432 RepID=UPI001746960E|nr:DUF3153 domain-containing protein [Polycladospora coralii]MBS7530332.1 DUF3153 domain-containing protein [Polycladospora coralii]
MFSQRKWLRVITALIFVVMLTGCVNASMHVTVNWDGSGSYEVKITANELIANQFYDIIDRLEQQGYTVKEVTEGEEKGWIATKEVDSVADEPPMIDLGEEAGSALHFFQKRTASTSSQQYATEDPSFTDLGEGVKMENNLFTTSITFDDQVDLTSLSDTEGELGGLGDLVFNQVNLDFILTLPLAADDHNATKVSEDGRTLTWELKPGEINPIQVTLDIPNILTWGIILLVVFIMIVALIVYLVLRRRKKKDSKPSPNPSSKQNDEFNWD